MGNARQTPKEQHFFRHLIFFFAKLWLQIFRIHWLKKMSQKHLRRNFEFQIMVSQKSTWSFKTLETFRFGKVLVVFKRCRVEKYEQSLKSLSLSRSLSNAHIVIERLFGTSTEWRFFSIIDFHIMDHVQYNRD